VAVKVIKPWWGEDPEWARNFEREAQLLASMSDPGIVQIFDVGSAPEGLYYVAELVDGESLAARLRRGPVPTAEACDIAQQLARALARAHERRVVHRDVKPANVLISRDGRIKVGDFGVAYLAEGSTDAAAATIAGTPKYMAPEQAEGEPTAPATDVYGVGIVLYEMLAGHPPFEGSSAVELGMHHVHDTPPPLPPDTPPALARIVERALLKDPAERYADGAELADALARARNRLSDRRVSAPDEDYPAAGSPGGGVATIAPPTKVVRGPAATGRTRVAPRPATPPGRAGSRRRTAADRRSRRERVPATMLGEPMSRRRNLDPGARRRRVAVLAFVALVAGGMLTGAILLAQGSVRVPRLEGMTKGEIRATAARMNFNAAFSSRYSRKRSGTAIAQSPRAHTKVKDGSTVAVVLSAGPAPVKVPALVHKSEQNAETILGGLKLKDTVDNIAAPGVTPGLVTAQSPQAGKSVAPGTVVTLSVAETPRYRPLTSFTSNGSGRSVPFEIRGTQWQIVESMSYVGTCTFIFICDGPTATVTDFKTGQTVDQFGLAQGSNHTRSEKLGAGVYQITISPGNDTARWQVNVDDYY
jgi:serine/threonine-protein kinase